MTLVATPANPVPDGAVAGFISTPDGARLRFARWAPPPNRKGTVCIFQGRSEFIEKYFEAARELRARGFAVAALDWRGQGLSSRALANPFKGHVGNFAEFDRDVETFMHEIVMPDCPPPYYALGHSMGGHVMIRLAAQRRRWFDRTVAVAPMIALPHRPFTGVLRAGVRAARLAGLGHRYVPGGSDANFDGLAFAGNHLTSDPLRFARNVAVMTAEPKLTIGAPTIGWLDAALTSMHAFADPGYAAAIRHPLLLIAAGSDAVVSTAAIEAFGHFLRGGSHLVIPGAQHEILQEQDRLRAQFWAAFDAFVPGTTG